jgi:molybdenum-dependent DNA-binding transcriptional regulator ModE
MKDAVHRLQFHYTLPRHRSRLIRNPLMDLLQAVREQGSISGAARALGLSYRHVWGELKRWEAELGNELVIWEQGPGGAADRVWRQAAVGRAPGPGPAGAAD